MEAGLIDVASYARWWHRRVFARAPHLIAFGVGESVGATLSGVVLPSTLNETQAAAGRLGLLVEERSSVSSLVPRSLVFRAPSQAALERFATSRRLPLYWLDVPGLEAVQPRHDGFSTQPGHYERTVRWFRWSLLSGEHPNVVVEHYMRRDRPDFWIVSADGRCIWSYDLNIARGWAATLLGEALVTVVDDNFLEARHAFLPLPIARLLGILGAGLSGPIEGKYRYVPGNSRLRGLALDIVSRVFNASRLAANLAEQATG